MKSMRFPAMIVFFFYFAVAAVAMILHTPNYRQLKRKKHNKRQMRIGGRNSISKANWRCDE